MNWVAMYGYPDHLRKMRAGDTGLFVCGPRVRGRLATVCAIWLKRNSDWAEDFWTAAHARGLLVGRGKHLANGASVEAPLVFIVEPSGSRADGPPW